MREIKFRIWDANTNEMRHTIGYWSLPTSSSYGMGEDASTVCLRFEIDTADGWNQYTLSPPNSILMQYTGLKDKNGKEIYEGDILHIKYMNIKNAKPCYAVVEYHAPYFVLVDNQDPPVIYPCKGHEINKIIGNIYENPELINS